MKVRRATEADLPTLVVHGLPDTVADVRTHLMNDRVWFSAFDLPSPQAPYIASEQIQAGETVECQGYKITAIEMQHTVDDIAEDEHARAGVVLEVEPGSPAVLEG